MHNATKQITIVRLYHFARTLIDNASEHENRPSVFIGFKCHCLVVSCVRCLLKKKNKKKTTRLSQLKITIENKCEIHGTMIL